MGNVFRRSSGRAWRLRQRSMELWPEWVEKLNHPDTPLRLDSPLVQLASGPEEAERMQSLAEQRSDRGLEWLTTSLTESSQLPWPNPGYGGLRSLHDGRLDPVALQRALRRSLQETGASFIPTCVTKLHRPQMDRSPLWCIELATGLTLHCHFVVVCTALATAQLLDPLGHERGMEAVLGQCRVLRVNDHPATLDQWPAVLVCSGINLIRLGSNRLWMGATLEPGEKPCSEETALMRRLGGLAPSWLQEAEVIDRWHGLRARPSGRPAPLLEILEPGLILASGHYRNGILLAPGTADWVSHQIMNISKDSDPDDTSKDDLLSSSTSEM